KGMFKRRCGKAENDVRDSEIDPGCYFRWQDIRPPTSVVKEELEFCYGRFSPSEELKRSSRTNAMTLGMSPSRQTMTRMKRASSGRLKSKGNHAVSSSSPGPQLNSKTKRSSWTGFHPTLSSPRDQ
ncbi:Uncharacterized protein FKW44_021669, partial [Caligus rogercresseyi]